MTAGTAYLLVDVAGTACALPQRSVREILPLPRLWRPPGAPAATASGPVTIGGKQFSSPQAARDYWLDKVNENTQNMPAYNVNGKTPDQQAAQLQENYEAAMNAVSATIPGGEHPVQATIPGYDPRILAQANSMYLPSSPAWKDFVTRTQAAYVQSMNARSMQQLKNQGMKDLWGTKENAINGRAAAAIGGHQAVANTNAGARIQAAQIRAAQMAWSSGNASVSGVAKSIMTNVPGTLPRDAYQQAIAAMPNAGAIVQGGPQPQQQQQPQQQPITGPIAVNPQTGQRMTVRNGAWVPLP